MSAETSATNGVNPDRRQRPCAAETLRRRGAQGDSRALRGTIAEELAKDSAAFTSEQDKNLLKFHGTYQQEDRDARKTRRDGRPRQALHVHGPLQDPRRAA